jgi:hypothetical protein
MNCYKVMVVFIVYSCLTAVGSLFYKHVVFLSELDLVL